MNYQNYQNMAVEELEKVRVTLVIELEVVENLIKMRNQGQELTDSNKNFRFRVGI